MAFQSYSNLASNWTPEATGNRLFLILVASTVATLLSIAIVLSVIEVPEKPRQQVQPVPERIAKFIQQKKKEAPKPKTKVEKPKPKPKPPKPKVEEQPKPKTKVVRKRPSEVKKKNTLTKAEKQAREKAKKSGVLALASELGDLIDTTDVSAQVGGKVKKGTSANKTTGVNTNVLTANVGAGSGGAQTSEYVANVGTEQIDARELALVKQSLLKEGYDGDAEEESVTTRTEEELTLVFDENKGQLYKLYDRERRKKPGLKGKVVVELTISPAGMVTDVKIASSELGSPSLERRLTLRIKQFKFEEKEVDEVTVTYPIDFLPS